MAQNLQVAIVGGGVCGLACAVALQNAGVDVQVFEAASAFEAIGGGIGLGPNAVRALESLGVLDELLKKLPPFGRTVKGFLFYSGLGDHELLYEVPPRPELPNVSMQRFVFLDALIALVDPQRTHLNKRCTSITQSPADPDRVIIGFLDGSTHETDVVLGADGIKSTVRDLVLNPDGADLGTAKRIAAAFSNSKNYRGMVPYSAIKAAGFKTKLSDRPVCFFGPHKHVIAIPILTRDMVVISASSTNYDVALGSQTLPNEKSWSDEVSRDELQKEFEGLGHDITTIMRYMPEKTPRWFLHVVHPPLESYARGRIALLGDAAHGMMPHLGAGAGQGLEDALLLARLLSNPSVRKGAVEAVLQAYSQVRRPRAQTVWELSYRAGRVYEHHGAHEPTPEGVKEDLQNINDPIWHHDLDDDLKAALQILADNGSLA
ncbi:salicylate hydroxylase [Fomes fomentarius]|nr:salicylate hydroxylase [Fomes fomentarius]